MEKSDLQKFVDAILDKKNVKAQQLLEKAMKDKVAKRISDTLNNNND